MDKLVEYLEKRIKHAEKRLNGVKMQHGSDPSTTHNYYGGQSLGYWQGKISAYECILDDIRDEAEKGANNL